MSDRLYFVSMIARALQEPDPAAALRKAFEEIRRLGSQPEYAQGYQQFLQFISEVRSGHESAPHGGEEPIPDVLAALMVERVDHALQSDRETHNTSAESIQSPWHEQYEQLWAEIRGAMERPPVCEILIEKNEVPVATCVIREDGKTQSITGIAPGDYRLVLETGRLLWQGRLDERHLIWSKAFPNQPLRMAADTGGADRRVTGQFDLMDGALVVRVCPGIETGSLEIQLQDTEAGA